MVGPSVGKKIEIHDSRGDILTVSLRDILKHLPGQDYSWCILHLWATGDVDPAVSVPELEDRIARSVHGIRVSWEQLWDLAGKFDQVIDIVILGSRDQTVLDNVSQQDDFECICDFVIDMTDGYCWTVSCQDDKLVEHLSKTFHQTNLVG